MSTSIAFDIIARDRASSKFDKVGNSADRSSGKLKKFAKVGALAVGAAAVVAGKALFDMGKAAIADEKAQAVLAQTLKNAAGATKGQVKATESWITAQGKALGVTDDELRPALGRLVAVTKDVGKAQKLTRLAMDVSAGSGKSLQAVTTALAKAQTGSVGGLSRLGVATKNADGSTKSLKEITEDLAKTYKGSAATAANTTEGKFKRLKVQFDETKEAIGAKLIPIASKLAGFLLNDVMPAASRLGGELKDKLGPTFEVIGGFIADKLAPALRNLAGKWLEGVRGMFKNVGKSMEDNKPFIDALVAGFKKLGEFLVSKVMPALGKIYEKVFPAIGTAIGLLITGLAKGSSAFLSLARFGVRAFRFLLNAAFTTFGGILTAAEKGMGWIPGIGGKIKKAKDAFDDFSDKTIAALDKTAAALKRTQNKIDGIKSPKPVKVDVNTIGAILKLNTLQQRINGLNGSALTFGARLPGTGTKGRAVGGYASGPTLLHEQGPEIIDLPRGGTRVYPAGRSAQMVRDLAAASVQPVQTVVAAPSLRGLRIEGRITLDADGGYIRGIVVDEIAAEREFETMRRGK